MKNTNHFICTVKDSINNYDSIGQIYCDVNTTKQAAKFFKSHPFIKKHIGNLRYQITFKQNSHLLQDSE